MISYILSFLQADEVYHPGRLLYFRVLPC